ncbi:hypothetical protein GS634_03085 [Ruegeria atlantica]|uniref:Uncharacterized protein n=1 Tax=Ruegeria atlantica TaxID=81569 RepID=A0AA90YU47_9RHOB|nr:hypothetical protein [Ruegeria atlantica]NOE17103.1 hypothetical protein [Ruegeria atlantica]
MNLYHEWNSGGFIERSVSEAKYVLEGHLKVITHGPLGWQKNVNPVLNWSNRPQTKGAVRQSIKIDLDSGLPDVYDDDVLNAKCDAIFHHFFEAYRGRVQSIFAAAHLTFPEKKICLH